MASTPQRARRTVTLERILSAAVDDVWEMWTTRDGIESWWGPEGFVVSVRSLDFRPGGDLVYVMTATAPDQVDFLRKAGMPISSEHRVTYEEIIPMKRLAYRHLVDFVPNLAPYEVATTVDLDASPQGVRMTLTIDAMHDEHWTQMAVRGWESELDRLTDQLKSA